MFREHFIGSQGGRAEKGARNVNLFPLFFKLVSPPLSLSLVLLRQLSFVLRASWEERAAGTSWKTQKPRERYRAAAFAHALAGDENSVAHRHANLIRRHRVPFPDVEMHLRNDQEERSRLTKKSRVLSVNHFGNGTK